MKALYFSKHYQQRDFLCFARHQYWPNGRGTAIRSDQISTLLPQFAPGVLQATVTPTTGLPPYARWGDRGVWLLSGVSLLIAWFLNRPCLPPPPSQQ